MNKDKFGEFVCMLRKEKGMTQQELGNKLHLTNKAISKWERGLSYPDICILQDVARILNVSVLELLNGERNTEIDISNEVANKVVEDTVKHSGQVIKKMRMKLIILISLLPLLIMVISYICFYLIKDEKSLDDALFTLIFIIIAAIISFIMYGMPLLGLLFTKKWYGLNLRSSNKKTRKIICVALYLIFSIWLLRVVIRVINNIV